MTGPQRRPTGRDAAKRLFDVAVASAAIVLLSPLILAIAIAVRVRLGKPTIFRQQRPGLRGQPFTMYKFRSMHDTTDESGKLVPESQRTPPFGQRLRALSLDELPELWNVLRGDMSLVGPRPLMMQYLPRYTSEQMRRHDVRPGITGLAQVGGRNALTWEQKFALDIDYVDHHDMHMDLSIMCRTFMVVLTREGISHSTDANMPEFMGTYAPSDAATTTSDGPRVR